MKAQYPDGNDVEFFALEARDTLNPKQRQIYNIVINAFDTENDPKQFLINVDGKGNSSKSYVIKVFSSYL